MPNINDFDDALIGACDDMLGDAIPYKPDGGVWGNVQAFVDYGEALRDIGAGQVIDTDIVITLSKKQAPSRPGSGTLLKLPKVDDNPFRPNKVQDMGDDWLFSVKRV